MTNTVFVKIEWAKACVIEQLTGFTPGALNKMRERGRILEDTHWKCWNNVTLYNYAAIQEFIANDSKAA